MKIEECKPGMLVRCIDDSAVELDISKGMIRAISKTSINSIELDGVRGAWFNPNRFEPVCVNYQLIPPLAPLFDEIITMHREWAKKNFPNAEKWEPLVGLQEEVGELAHAFLKNHQGIRLNEPHQENMADAVGDCVMYLLHFCTLNGIDFMQAVRDVWMTISQRDWQRYPANGTKVALAGVLGEK